MNSAGKSLARSAADLTGADIDVRLLEMAGAHAGETIA
jgi:hypothetical protein